MKIILIGALPDSIIKFRKELIDNFLSINKNTKVIAMASNASELEIKNIEDIATDYIDYPVSRNGLNPIKDFLTLVSLYKNYKAIQPDLIFAYTIKPIIWGGIAARFAKIPAFYALITGLGYAFQSGGIVKNGLNWLVKYLYKIALKNAKAIIFQNQDNMNTFINQGIVPKDKCFVVNGSGVNLNFYQKTPLPSDPRFLLIARLLVDKGIGEYVQAARLVKEKYPEVIFEILGPEDPSPNGIKIEEINKWCQQGIIKYSGSANDVRPYIENCSIYVLPSYHEGLPRSVLEAMAMGRPILTTNVSGCKETVVDGVNGWLVEKASSEQLAERMIWFIENKNKWSVMGENSYQMVEEKFDVHKVNDEIMRILELTNK